MKIFVTGANGFLGQHLIKLLLEKNFQVIGTGKGASRLLFADENYTYFSLDISNEKAVEDILSTEKPDILIHTAAMTRVDDCEQNQNECFKINVLGTSFVLRSAEKYANHFIHISTDFVFDGKKGNYKEDDPLGYVNWYGFTKIEAEQLVKRSIIPWSIVRTCLVYGNALYGTRSNIISWTKNKLEKKERIKVVNDQVRTPTYVDDLAQGIAAIVDKKATGIFHISGREVLTPYIMSVRTADFFSLDKNLIEQVNASNFSEPAKRPPKTGFIIDKAIKELGFAPISFDEGLKLMY